MSEKSFYKKRLLINPSYRIFYNYLKNCVSFTTYNKQFYLYGNEAATFLKLFPLLRSKKTLTSLLKKAHISLALTLRIIQLLKKNGLFLNGNNDSSKELFQKLTNKPKFKITSFNKISIGVIGKSSFSSLLYKRIKDNSARSVYWYKNWIALKRAKLKKNILLVGNFDNNEGNKKLNNFCLLNHIRWLHSSINYKSYQGIVGPLTYKKENACYQCLQERLKENLLEDTGTLLSKGNLLLSKQVKSEMEHIVVREILSQILKKKISTNIVRIINFPDNRIETNNLTQKYDCSGCGPNNKSATVIKINPIESIYAENGLRSISSSKTYRNALRLTGKVGIINELKENTFKKNYLGLSTWESITANPNENPYADRKHWGKGLSITQNKVSALSEGVERYYSKLVDPNSIIFESYNNLKDKAIDPNVFTLPKIITYPKFIKYNPDLKIDWVWGYSLTNKRRILIPMVLVNYPSFASSAGLSSGNNMEEAVLSGIFEVVERDASMISELNTLCMPDVDISQIKDKGTLYFKNLLDKKGIHYYVKYISNDISIPIFQVFLQGIFKGNKVYSCGHGAHLNKDIALLRAITEAIQIYPKYDFCEWIRTRPINHLYEKGPKLLDFNTIPDYKNNNFKKNIDRCLSILKTKDMEVCVADFSKEEIGFKVVRVLISNTQPCFAGEHHRLAKRVFEIPRIMGYRETDSKISDLLIGSSPFIRRCKTPAPGQIIYCEK